MNTTTALQAHSLNSVVAHSVRALIRRFHLNRDWIIGFIGDRGSGKSLSAANVVVRDFMMNGEKCFSNMSINHTIKVPDEIARHYGLEKGGEINYESEYIDKQSFLMLDNRYEGGVLMFDEFNIDYGEARRSLANVNLMTDRAIQQLRKLQCGLIYTVLDEMYVDSRIRENTDIFIKCQDTALNLGALKERKTQGREFEWIIYPLSAKYAGNGRTYKETKKSIGPIPVEMGSIWGIIDTYERQGVGARKYSETLMPVKTQEDEQTKEEKVIYNEIDTGLDLLFTEYANKGDEIIILTSDLAQRFGKSMRQVPALCTKIYDRVPEAYCSGNGSRQYPSKIHIPNKRLLAVVS